MTIKSKCVRALKYKILISGSTKHIIEMRVKRSGLFFMMENFNTLMKNLNITNNPK
jgi:hypothetical protein